MISYPGPPDTTLIYMNLTLDLPWEQFSRCARYGAQMDEHAWRLSMD